MTTAIAICNQKGGVAKTTTCLSLGACLVEMGYKVLLVDFDPQSHLTLSLRIRPEELPQAVGDVLLGNSSLVDISRKTSIVGLDIAPANQELTLIDKLLYGREDYEFQLKQKLEAPGNHYYDFVLIDCAPTFGTLTLNALTAANKLLIPALCEYYVAHSLKTIIALAKMVQQKTNPQLTYQVLVTMYDRRNRICRLIFEQMQRDLSSVLCQTVVGIDVKLKEGSAFGQPITLYAPKARGAQQYRALAKELIQNGR